MNVLQLFTTAPTSEVVEAHNRLYPGNDAITTQDYSRFVSIIKGKVLVKNPLKVVINHWVVKHDDPVDDTDSVAVQLEDAEGCHYSMSFHPWGEVLASEFSNNSDIQISLADQIAHVYWELTLSGLEEDMEEQRDIVNDRMEEVLRGTARTTSFSTEDVWDQLFPEYSPERRNQLREESILKIDNYRTQKRYKNGILQLDKEDS